MQKVPVSWVVNQNPFKFWPGLVRGLSCQFLHMDVNWRQSCLAHVLHAYRCYSVLLCSLVIQFTSLSSLIGLNILVVFESSLVSDNKFVNKFVGGTATSPVMKQNRYS